MLHLSQSWYLKFPELLIPFRDYNTIQQTNPTGCTKYFVIYVLIELGIWMFSKSQIMNLQLSPKLNMKYTLWIQKYVVWY